MTTTAFPPVAPLIGLFALIRKRIHSANQAEMSRHLRTILSYGLVALVILAIGLRKLPGLAHRALKGSIIALRFVARQLERLDAWIEQLKADNQSFLPKQAEDQDHQTTSAPAPHPLAALADDLWALSPSELKAMTNTRKRTDKQTMIHTYLSMPV